MRSQQVYEQEDDVSTRMALADVPLHICFETLNEVPSELPQYAEETALRVGDVTFVKNAPITK